MHTHFVGFVMSWLNENEHNENEQTVQTQIMKEQSDQGLHFLLFLINLLEANLYKKKIQYMYANFKAIEAIITDALIFWPFTG